MISSNEKARIKNYDQWTLLHCIGVVGKNLGYVKSEFTSIPQEIKQNRQRQLRDYRTYLIPLATAVGCYGVLLSYDPDSPNINLYGVLALAAALLLCLPQTLKIDPTLQREMDEDTERLFLYVENLNSQVRSYLFQEKFRGLVGLGLPPKTCAAAIPTIQQAIKLNKKFAEKYASLTTDANQQVQVAAPLKTFGQYPLSLDLPFISRHQPSLASAASSSSTPAASPIPPTAVTPEHSAPTLPTAVIPEQPASTSPTADIPQQPASTSPTAVIPEQSAPPSPTLDGQSPTPPPPISRHKPSRRSLQRSQKRKGRSTFQPQPDHTNEDSALPPSATESSPAIAEPPAAESSSLPLPPKTAANLRGQKAKKKINSDRASFRTLLSTTASPPAAYAPALSNPPSSTLSSNSGSSMADPATESVLESTVNASSRSDSPQNFSHPDPAPSLSADHKKQPTARLRRRPKPTTFWRPISSISANDLDIAPPPLLAEAETTATAPIASSIAQEPETLTITSTAAPLAAIPDREPPIDHKRGASLVEKTREATEKLLAVLIGNLLALAEKIDPEQGRALVEALDFEPWRIALQKMQDIVAHCQKSQNKAIQLIAIGPMVYEFFLGGQSTNLDLIINLSQDDFDNAMFFSDGSQCKKTSEESCVITYRNGLPPTQVLCNSSLTLDKENFHQAMFDWNAIGFDANGHFFEAVPGTLKKLLRIRMNKIEDHDVGVSFINPSSIRDENPAQFLLLIKSLRNNWQLLSQPLQRDCNNLSGILTTYLRTPLPVDAKQSKRALLLTAFDNALADLIPKTLTEESIQIFAHSLEKPLAKTLLYAFVTADATKPYHDRLRQSYQHLLSTERTEPYTGRLRQWLLRGIIFAYQNNYDITGKILPWLVAYVLFTSPAARADMAVFISKIKKLIANTPLFQQATAANLARLESSLPSIFNELSPSPQPPAAPTTPALPATSSFLPRFFSWQPAPPAALPTPPVSLPPSQNTGMLVYHYQGGAFFPAQQPVIRTRLPLADLQQSSSSFLTQKTGGPA